MRLGPYEILSPIGAGGMGEVYRARDTRLDRIVAIKVLPEHVATDHDLKQRFEREARTVAALSHPHICTLHDIGSEGGIDFLVLEYLEGETLAQRLRKGGLRLDLALQTAIEIADALNKAHRQGVVHRDLKPSNVMLTEAGAKLLDFGLAKLRKPGTVPAEGFSAAATETESLTARGTLLGTLPYMAPEQVEGKEADARTDIFAFGALLYEMVSGTRAFVGDSQAGLIAAILDRQPTPIATLQPISPLALNHLVETCLAKSPDDRWQSAGDIKRELAWIAESEARASVPAPTPADSRPTSSRRAMPWVIAMGASIIAALAVWSMTRPEPTAPGEATRFTISAPNVVGAMSLALSRDGRTLAYLASEDGVTRLYRRPFNEVEATEIPGAESVGRPMFQPFFSPDGSWVGYFEVVDLAPPRVALQKVLATGGPPVTLWDGVMWVSGGSWGPDDTIVVGGKGELGEPERGWGLWRLSATGGEPEQITTVDTDQGESRHGLPDLLPGGEAVLFQVMFEPLFASRDPSQIAVLSLETGEHRLLLEGSSPHYARTGHIVFVRGESLWRVPFDLERLEVTGEPLPVLDGVSVAPAQDMRFASFSLGADGSLAYIPSAPVQHRLVWVDRQGREAAIGLPANTYGGPLRVSPDGTRVAIASLSDTANVDVWIGDLERGTLSRLTTDAASDGSPLWTLDGERVVFASGREGGGVFERAADGTGPVERVMEDRVGPMDWSADGKMLVFNYGESDGQPGSNIGVLALDGDGAWAPLLDTDAYELMPAISPDGAWIAYLANQTGRIEVYVERFPELGDRQQISTDGAFGGPTWSPDGGELFYRRPGDGAMMVVALDTNPTVTAGPPELLFDGPYALAPEWAVVASRDYDLAPDGERFLMMRSATDGGSGDTQIIVVQNWLDELEQRLPSR